MGLPCPLVRPPTTCPEHCPDCSPCSAPCWACFCLACPPSRPLKRSLPEVGVCSMQHCFSGPPNGTEARAGGGGVNSGETPSDQGLCSLKGVKSWGFSGLPCRPPEPSAPGRGARADRPLCSYPGLYSGLRDAAYCQTDSWGGPVTGVRAGRPTILEGWVGDGSSFEGTPPPQPTTGAIYHSPKAAIVVGMAANQKPEGGGRGRLVVPHAPPPSVFANPLELFSLRN